MKYRKKPIVIEAMQFSGNNCFEIMAFMGRTKDVIDAELNQTDYPTIHTLEGDLSTSPGDWIIKTIKGELYVCEDDIFRESYDEFLPEGE